MSRPAVPPRQSVLVPLSQFVLKVHSRCDLACDHCYVYEAADQSWRGRPAAISDEVISQAARPIAEHAAAHGLSTVQVVLHGGEPLLADRARLRRVAAELHAALRGVCHLDLRIHTNGVLLNEDFCGLFAEHGIKVGISIDGDRAAALPRTPEARTGRITLSRSPTMPSVLDAEPGAGIAVAHCASSLSR